MSPVRSRGTVSALASVLLALICASSATGATASVVSGDVTYAAASGEGNGVELFVVRGVFRFTDLGAVITAGVGCSSVGPHEVICETAADYTDVFVRVGDEHDAVTIRPHGPDEEASWQWANSRVYGGAGDDLLKGGRWMVGGLGNDILLGSSNLDHLFGGPGYDSLRGRGDVSDDLHGGPGNDWLYHGPAADDLAGGPGQDAIYGLRGRDSVLGGPGADRLFGRRGGDFILGEGGNDRIVGGLGKDHLQGGEGYDTIVGGGGHLDELRGGPGNDSFYARDGLKDTVFGGRGLDRARLDNALDLVHGVELRVEGFS